jgi:DNA invertase Pin-like site-specific DNA recombinase
MLHKLAYLHQQQQPHKHCLLYVANRRCTIKGMKYAYARVSTADQNPRLQFDALERAGIDRKHIFTDNASGATTNRPKLKALMKRLQYGDTLVVWKLDRLGRSLRDLVYMLDDFKQRRIQFVSLTEAIDTTTPTGRAMFQLIGVFAELERSIITERIRAGVTAARKRGIKFGRKPKLTAQQLAHAHELLDKGESRQYVADLLRIDRATLWRTLTREARC